MKIYISGPMTGIVACNVPEFARVTMVLRERGYIVVSPHEVCPGDSSWFAYLRRDLTEMLTCDAIVRMPKWQKSRGAKLEHHVADALNFAIYDLVNDQLKPANKRGFVLRDAGIVAAYYTGSATMEELGTAYGLTKMRISQIISKAGGA